MKLVSKKRSNRWLVLDQSFFAMFITFSLIELANVGAGLIDGLIVSNLLHAEAMAAVGIAYPIFSISGVFGGMFAAGMQTLCTRELGRGDVHAFNRLFSTVMYLGTAFSIALTVTLLIGATPLALLLGASGKGASLAAPTVQYLRGVGIGLPGLIMAQVLSSAISMDSGRKRVIISALIYSGLNALLNLAAVALDMGIFGIGLATAVGQYLQIGYLILHFRGRDRMLRFVALKTSLKEMLSLLYNGTEKALRRLCNILRPILVNKLIIFYGGALAMTAMSVQTSLQGFSQFFAVGLADAVALQIGVLFGEMNDEGIREAGKCIRRNCVIFSGAICLIFFLFARPIAKLYISEDGELLNMTVFAVRIIALQAPLNGLVRSRITYLQAVGRTRNMQLLAAVTFLVYVVLNAFVFGAAFGPYGVLASALSSDFLSLATVWLYYAITKRRMIPTSEDYMALPENFHRSPGDVILLDVRDEEDVSLVSQQIQLFCKGHKIDNQTGYAAAVCFEELAVNTIKHGFPICKKTPGIDLRVVYDPKELIIRIQDNCPSFNVERQIAITLSEGTDNMGEHLGLKILGGMATDIKYVHSLETNNVILHFSLNKRKKKEVERAKEKIDRILKRAGNPDW